MENSIVALECIYKNLLNFKIDMAKDNFTFRYALKNMKQTQEDLSK